MAMYRMFFGNLATSPPVTIKNYYAGGFANAKRLTRGLGFSVLFLLLMGL